MLAAELSPPVDYVIIRAQSGDPGDKVSDEDIMFNLAIPGYSEPDANDKCGGLETTLSCRGSDGATLAQCLSWDDSVDYRVRVDQDCLQTHSVPRRQYPCTLTADLLDYPWQEETPTVGRATQAVAVVVSDRCRVVI